MNQDQDIVDKFSTHLKNVLTRALCLVVETNEKIIRPEHLLWALGTQKGCIGAEVLKKAGIKNNDFKKLVNVKSTVMSSLETGNLNLHLSENAKRIVEKAVLTANHYGHRYVGTEHLLSGIIQIEDEDKQIHAFFIQVKTNLKELTSQLSIVLKSTSKFPDFTRSISDPNATPSHPHKLDGMSETEKKISALEYFAVELTSANAQKRIDPVIGREMEIERVMEILCRRTKNNPLLLGEPGVGKTAIVEGLAKQITQGLVPPVLQHKRIFAIDMALLIAGTMYRGEFEGRLRQIVDEVKADPDILLFIDELHTIVGAGAASGSMDAANILKPALARGEIRCIGATTPVEFKKHIESDPALERRFQTVLVEEPTQEKAIEILEGIAPYYEQFHRVRITHEALKNAVTLSSRYMQDKQLPDKAIDLIDEAAASSRVRDLNPGPAQKERELYQTLEQIKETKRKAVVEEQFEEALHLKEEEEHLQKHLENLRAQEDCSPVPVISAEEVARVVSRASGIPLDDLISSNKSQLLKLEEQLRLQILGQEPVIETVAGALRRAKTGVAHPNRPLASFLFLGPSGVGKTELAKTIAEILFHSKQHFIRLDMSEYAEGFSISKVIGAPAGYVGYKEGSNLADRVKQRPYSVVLFDEIEKAHNDVQNLLLQILEEGELTDSTGRKINFKNTIVIMTSNVGLERFERGGMGFMADTQQRQLSLNEDLRTELTTRFRPELLNRIDHLCIFQPLEQTILEQIIQKQLNELAGRLKGQGLTLSIDKNLTHHLRSFIEPLFGARTIRSQIQKEVEHKIAERLSKADRVTSLKIKVVGKKIRITKTKK
ncbi:TPA: ATP-dependent Clp protease ATP-binding subunit ClpC [Candidatus Uhrbacteria bacterium]|nr:ATP-dependent Clp protease ATP-binding subunit ClpC [Candidatus Uhrbacteria bacterium]